MLGPLCTMFMLPGQMIGVSDTSSPAMAMGSLMWTMYVAAALFVSVVLLSMVRQRRKINLPPGPKPWPIIGNLNLLGPLPYRSIHDLSLKFGPLMQLWFGSKPVIVVSSMEMAKQILKTYDVNFATRPQTAAGKYTACNFSNMTWSPYGPYWRQARKMYALELVSTRRLESFEYIRVEEVKDLVSRVFTMSGHPINFRDQFSTVSLSIISRFVMGKKYLDEPEVQRSIFTLEEFKEMLDEFFLLNGVPNIGDFIPWIDFLDLQGYIKRMKVVSNKYIRFVEHVIDEHNARRVHKDFVPKDMVDFLLQQTVDPNADVQLCRENVIALIEELLGGGTESSAVTAEWAMSELLKHPQMLDKVWEELDRVVGKERWVEEKDMDKLLYVDAVIKETFRLHTVAPILTPHFARENCKIDGYDILSGTRVLVSAWSIMRDPATWDSPEEFRPERFLGISVDMKGQDFTFLPFGAGRRMCPAYSLGLKVVQLMLSNVLHGFNWKLPANMAPGELNMDETCGMTMRRKYHLLAIGEPRLPSHLYL